MIEAWPDSKERKQKYFKATSDQHALCANKSQRHGTRLRRTVASERGRRASFARLSPETAICGGVTLLPCLY